MTRIAAFVEDDPTAGRVVSMAMALANLLSVAVEVVHVGERAGPMMTEAARSADVPLRLQRGAPIDEIVAEMSSDQVVAGVLGARRESAGPRPVGSTALEVITRVDKLVAVVPPEAIVPSTGIHRILVPLDGTRESAAAVEVLSEACARSGVEILVVHVFEQATIPAFWDQPFHAAEAFGTEFLARFMARPGTELRLRTGVPCEGVLDAVEQEPVDVVALGWSQHLDAGRAEVVRRVLGEAPIPVLLVPSE